jgi:starch-binding outer membrane protein, SusD/RagB family
MKNIRLKRKYILLPALTLLFSCKGALDILPKGQVADPTVWSSTANADLFLNNVYGSIADQSKIEDPEDNRTDDALYKNSGSSVGSYNKAGYGPSNGPTYWGNYTSIRKANLFIEKVTASSFPASYKKLRLAEARFIRAWWYMGLWTHHGGVPIITDVLNISEDGDAILRARNTDAETFKFIVDECTAIAPDLPAVRQVSGEPGRITRGAALTLKAYCELFNASLLKNPANDVTRWATAAASFKAVMDMNLYSLFSNFETQFYEENDTNPEVIFSKQHLGNVGALGNGREGQQGPAFIKGVLASISGVNPTQQMVDAFRMANGKDITDPTSGYDPQNPYVGREKRFYSSIVYDGSIWFNEPFIMKQGVGSANRTDLGNVDDATNTGYYHRKMLNEKYATTKNNNMSSADNQFFRYANVLLMYAEAKNEATGPDAAVLDAINKVRVRSELPALPAGLTQAQMRDEIRKERRIELFMEEWRWYDLVRWKTAEVVLNQASKGMRIDLVGGKPVYTIITPPNGGRTFNASKNYLFPIPQSAIDKNPKLTQNPGY